MLVISTVIFPSAKFTPLTAKRWLKRHRLKPISGIDRFSTTKFSYKIHEVIDHEQGDRKEFPNGVVAIAVKTSNINGSGVFDPIVNFFKGRKAGLLPPKVRKLLEQHGTESVVDARVCRKPISISGVTNAISLGKYQEYLKSKNFDDLFHLWMEVATDKGRYLLEKNSVINAEANPNIKDAECAPASLNGNKRTLNELFENTRKRMGDKLFTSYDGRRNNCQDFVMNMLKSNGFGNNETYTFVKQDTERVFEGTPSIMEKLMNFATTLSSRVDVAVNGQGVKSKILFQYR